MKSHTRVTEPAQCPPFQTLAENKIYIEENYINSLSLEGWGVFPFCLKGKQKLDGFPYWDVVTYRLYSQVTYCVLPGMKLCLRYLYFIGEITEWEELSDSIAAMLFSQDCISRLQDFAYVVTHRHGNKELLSLLSKLKSVISSDVLGLGVSK